MPGNCVLQRTVGDSNSLITSALPLESTDGQLAPAGHSEVNESVTSSQRIESADRISDPPPAAAAFAGTNRAGTRAVSHCRCKTSACSELARCCDALGIVCEQLWQSVAVALAIRILLSAPQIENADAVLRRCRRCGGRDCFCSQAISESNARQRTSNRGVRFADDEVENRSVQRAAD